MIGSFIRVAALFIAIGTAQASEPAYRGSFTQGGMVIGVVDPGTRVWLGDRPLDVTADGSFVFGFARDAAPQALLHFEPAGGSRTSKLLTISARTYDIERVDGLPPRTVTVPEEERLRRRRETGMVRDARADGSVRLDWLGPFLRPAVGRISGVYGSQRILNGQPRWPHYGLDIAAPTGTPIQAPLGGRVVLAEPDFLLEGGIVIIDHGFGVSSTLFHMSRVDVTTGDVIARGDLIGAIGAAGRASGPHVDWRVNWQGVRLDPGLLIDLTKDMSE